MTIKSNKTNAKLKKSKGLGLKALSALMLASGLNPIIYSQSAYAQAEAPTVSENPYIQTLLDSEDVYNEMNYFFNTALQLKANEYQRKNEDYLKERFYSNSYLVQRPINVNYVRLNKNQKVTYCNLNNAVYVNEPLNHYPFSPLDNQRSFSDEVNNAYCLLQHTFDNLSDSDLKLENTPTKFINNFDVAKNNLKESDTLVVVIPGIFGEFIEPVAFGEIFGQGLTKVDNGNKEPEESSFAKAFNKWISDNKDTEDVKELLTSKRLTLKDINTENYPLFTIREKKLYYDKNININDWIKVSSYDDADRKPLFKVAIMGLAPMSLESIGKQKNLAITYLRRLNKFMEIYKKMNNGKYPGKIVFVGYSRGTPIAYEMLSILFNQNLNNSDGTQEASKNIQINAQEWKTHLKAMLSLGGVSIGSSLADASVIYRDKYPDKVKLLHAFREFMFNLQIVTKNDIVDFENHMNNTIAKTKPNAVKGDKVTIEVNQDVNTGLVNKIAKNILEYQKFRVRVAKITASNHEVEIIKASYDLFNEIQDIYSNLIMLTDGLKENTSFQDEKTRLIAAGKALSSIPEVTKKFLALVGKLKDLSKNVPALSLPGFSGLKNLKEAVNEIVPGTDPNSKFNELMLKNFGLDQITASLEKIKETKNPLKVLTVVNDLLIRFKVFFEHAWDGGHELGTLARLSWLANNARSLPHVNFKYYTVNGVFGDTGKAYYEGGLNFGFNVSTDQNFLVPSSKEISTIGRLNGADGLDKTFSGTVWNDSQVDWHKTILWPSLVSTLTNGEVKIDSKLIATVRTHHWGLALPYSAYNVSSTKPSTGIKYAGDDAKFTSVNPFPRKEFLLATLLTINEDLARPPKSNNLNLK